MAGAVCLYVLPINKITLWHSMAMHRLYTTKYINSLHYLGEYCGHYFPRIYIEIVLMFFSSSLMMFDDFWWYSMIQWYLLGSFGIWVFCPFSDTVSITKLLVYDVFDVLTAFPRAILKNCRSCWIVWTMPVCYQWKRFIMRKQSWVWVVVCLMIKLKIIEAGGGGGEVINFV